MTGEATARGQRERMLDAACAAAVAGRWNQLRMADVAAAAGVSRQTVYNTFGSRDALARAVALRETNRFLARVDRAFEEAGGELAAALEGALLESLRITQDNALIKAVLTAPDDSEVATFFTTRADVILDASGEQLRRRLRTGWPHLDLGDIALVAEMLPRLLLSHIVSPGGPPEAVARRLAKIALRCLQPTDARGGL
ncbi:MAG: TetR family transcriptional regulator [Frankia sp.]|nr:TetR family transcriptional regulator [Frankia sp.]